jgi:hypothetical protein
MRSVCVIQSAPICPFQVLSSHLLIGTPYAFGCGDLRRGLLGDDSNFCAYMYVQPA